MSDIVLDPTILKEIDVFEQVAEAREIHTEADEADAARFIQMIKARAKDLDAERKKHVKPLNDKTKAVNALFKGPINRLAAVEKKLKMGIFQSVQERERRNREALQAAQHAAQHGGNVSQHLDSIEDRPLPPATSIRSRWEYEIIDPNQVPGNLWSPDPAKIEAELAKHNDFANPPTIPGVRITVGGSVTVRSAKK